MPPGRATKASLWAMRYSLRSARVRTRTSSLTGCEWMMSSDVVAEEGGDDAHHAAALLQGRAAGGAHQPQIAAAVEQRVAAAGDGAAELPRGLCDLFAVRERRPAED